MEHLGRRIYKETLLSDDSTGAIVEPSAAPNPNHDYFNRDGYGCIATTGSDAK